LQGRPITPSLAAIVSFLDAGDSLFIGHFAVAFAAKRAAPAVSLGTLFLAAQLADLVWPTLVLLGVESVEIRPGITAMTPLDFIHYPYSHSLVALVAWSVALAVVYGLRHQAATRSAWILAAVVLSHWLLDVVSHRPDMPVTLGGDARLGLGLWYSIPGTMAVEIPLYIGAALLYARATTALDPIGRHALWALVAFLLIVYFASAFGPPPPSSTAVAWSAEAIWLLVAWGYWVDRHRGRAGVGA
jgi:hypothetical protein